MTDYIADIFTSNKKPYGVALVLGIVGGIMLYHSFGKTIDKYGAKVPYWNRLPSYYAMESE